MAKNFNRMKEIEKIKNQIVEVWATFIKENPHLVIFLSRGYSANFTLVPHAQNEQMLTIKCSMTHKDGKPMTLKELWKDKS